MLLLNKDYNYNGKIYLYIRMYLPGTDVYEKKGPMLESQEIGNAPLCSSGSAIASEGVKFEANIATLRLANVIDV
jgi:hypothetical protein